MGIDRSSWPCAGESAVPAGPFREFLKPNSGVQLSFKRQGLTSFSNDTENMPLERNVVVFETLDGDGDSSREAGPSQWRLHGKQRRMMTRQSISCQVGYINLAWIFFFLLSFFIVVFNFFYFLNHEIENIQGLLVACWFCVTSKVRLAYKEIIVQVVKNFQSFIFASEILCLISTFSNITLYK